MATGKGSPPAEKNGELVVAEFGELKKANLLVSMYAPLGSVRQPVMYLGMVRPGWSPTSAAGESSAYGRYAREVYYDMVICRARVAFPVGGATLPTFDGTNTM